MKLRVGIIGAGRIGECHLKGYNNLDEVKIVGVADLSSLRREYFKNRYGLKIFKDFENLLKLKPDIVSICTPDFAHLEPSISSAEMGANILCEKPLAMTLQDAQRIVRACKENGVYLSVGYKFRYDRIYRQTKNLLENKTIGDPISVYIARPQEISKILEGWSIEVGVDVSNLCHEVDLAYWFLDSEPRYVFANYQKGVGARKNPTRVTFYLQHDNGAQSILYCGTEQEFPPVGGVYDSKFHIVGTKGYILGERPDRLVICDDVRPSIHYYPIEISNYFQRAFNDEIKSFVDSVKLSKEPEITGEDGLRALRVINSARKSFARGTSMKIT